MQERGAMSELVPEHGAIFDKHRKKVVRENSLPCGFKRNLDIFFSEMLFVTKTKTWTGRNTDRYLQPVIFHGSS